MTSEVSPDSLILKHSLASLIGESQREIERRERYSDSLPFACSLARSDRLVTRRNRERLQDIDCVRSRRLSDRSTTL